MFSLYKLGLLVPDLCILLDSHMGNRIRYFLLFYYIVGHLVFVCEFGGEGMLFNLIVGKRLMHLKSEKFNSYARITQSIWGFHTNL